MFALTPLLSLFLFLPYTLSVDVNATCATLEAKLPVFYSGEYLIPFS